ncbi:MAG TPA: 2-phospho-L-lactate transferase [Anaerolineae bacterium]|nr:2-phospho-L-lactate transferase [Anaerolineales bacterium]HRV93610.1 2-phospho-L-lactate transferase [Anaerolineae bacterium]
MTKITQNVVALAGGVGGSKLAYGLAQIVAPEHLTIIVNTGDDFEHLGLYIAPDLDTVMYTLAGVNNPATGWGVKDESWNMMAAMARYIGPTWFQLGDRDLATHLLRTTWLHDNYSYNQVTKELCRRLGVRCTVLPMTEQPVRTMVQTESGELAFQEYFVKLKCEPVVTGLRYAGAEGAQPSREVVSAVRQSDVIVFCPSNPLLSLDPILALPTMRRVLAASRSPKIAVSPLIKGQALKGPAAKLMKELNMDVSATGVAHYLREVLTGFVIDHADQAEEEAITNLGLRTLVTGTVMTNNETKVQLAQEILAFAGIS